MTSKFVSVIVNDEEGNQLQQSLSDSSSASGYNLFSPNRQPKDTQIISQFFDLQLEIRTQIHDIEKMQEFVELLREHLIALIAKKKQETSEIQNRHPKDINNSPSFDVLHLNQKNLKLRSTSRNSGNDEAEDVQTKIHMKPTNAEKQLEMFSSRLLAENQNTAGSNPFFFGKGVSRDDLLRGSRQFSVPSKLDVNHIRDTRQTLEARSNDEIVKTGQMQKSFEVSDKSIPMNTIDEDAHQSSESITMPRNMKPLDQSRTSQKATINPLFANRPDIAARLGTDIQSAKYKKSQNSSESLFKSSSRQVSVESQLASNNSSSYSISNYQRIISSRDASRVGSRTGSSEFPTVRNIAHTGSSDLESLRNFKRESTTTRPSDFSVHGANSRRFSKQMSSISDIGTRRASQFEGSMDLARASVTRYLPKGILGSTGEFQHPRASSARRASKLMSATSDSTTSMERSIHKLGNSIVRVQNVEMEIESESEEDELDEFLDNVMEQKPLKQIVYDFFRNEAYTKSGRRIHKFDYVDEKVSKISGFGVHQRSMCRTLWDFFISFLYMFVIVFIPMEVSFNSHLFSKPETQSITLACSILFAIDTILDLLTNSHDPTTDEVLPLFASMHKKLKLRFWVDIISILPFEVLIPFEKPEIFLVFRMLRLSNLSEKLTSPIFSGISLKVQSIFQLNTAVTGIIFYITTMLLFLHFHATFMFLFGKITHFHDAAWKNPRIHLNGTVWEQYAFGWWAAVSNTFPVNGDIIPYNMTEQWVSTVMILIGVILLARLNGSFSAYALWSDPSRRKYKEYVEEVGFWMTTKKLPNELRDQVFRYLEGRYDTGKYFNEEEIRTEMNDYINTEISVHSCTEIIISAGFLIRNQNDGSDESFLRLLISRLTEHLFIAGDIVFRSGEISDCMYFVRSGTLLLTAENGVKGEIGEGHFFGEGSILFNQTYRKAHVAVLSNAILYKLQRKDWLDILELYPDMQDHVDLYRQAYLQM